VGRRPGGGKVSSKL